MRTSIVLASSGTIDMYEDLPLSLNYSIADIKEPDKRNSDYSKTIKIPGTGNNNKLFGHIFEIDINCNFNPTVKSACSLMVDGMPVLVGYLQLINVYRDRDKIEYDVTILSNVGSLFSSIGERLLTDLNLTSYNHTYNDTNQQASWVAAVGDGYVYPFIDYGYNNGQVWKVEDLKPAIYAKTYIDKIFQQAGYTYTSPFFNSDYFKRLIIPYTNGTLKYTDSQIQSRLFESAAGGAQTYAPTNYNRLLFPTDISDTNNYYDNTNSLLSGLPLADYTFTLTFNFTVTTYSASAGLKIGINFIKHSAGVATTFSNHTIIPTGLGTYSVTINSNSINLFPSAVMEVKVYIMGNLNITINSSTRLKNNVLNTLVKTGDVIDANGIIPQNIKQKDFLKSIINMHNLYIDTDNNNPSNVFVEPRNDFYSSGTVKDWSGKLDISTPIVINPVANINTKKYIYAYKDDKDYYNSFYKQHKLEAYGTRKIELNNDFITGETNTEIIFSPTPLIKNNNTDMLLSSISPNSIGNISQSFEDYNIRILYYGGLVTTTNTLKYDAYTLTTFPYAGHLDSYTNPTRDLCFGTPKEVYFLTSYYTTNNLYNMYYKKFIDEITSKDSKLITAYFHLTALDIYLLDFRNIFMLNGHALRLNKIIDYNCIENGTCKCEFINISEEAQFIGTTYFTLNGIKHRVSDV